MYGSFFGWYFKCQSDTQTLALIPAIHKTGKRQTCSLQVLTDAHVWTLDFPSDSFRLAGQTIYLENNRFGTQGILLAVDKPELHLEGALSFGPLTPLKYPIMGPFSFLPFMECRHSVWSMLHSVQGTLLLNGQSCLFDKAWGYWEGDQGRSFPKTYLWTQCCFPEGSLMLSVADIPMLGTHFTGIIGIILWKGVQYRLATYLGAKAMEIKDKTVKIVQGKLEFTARLLEESKHPLKAPTKGAMVRTIHESAACRAFYQLRKDGNLLFSFESDRASFEYEYEHLRSPSVIK